MLVSNSLKIIIYVFNYLLDRFNISNSSIFFTQGVIGMFRSVRKARHLVLQSTYKPFKAWPFIVFKIKKFF